MRVRTLSLTILLVSTLLTVAPAPVVEPAQASLFVIQPGDQVIVGGAGCTLNFVYDGTGALDGNVYVGTAAHCVGHVGQAARSSGITFGKVAFIRSACCTGLDYAFIEVDVEYHDWIDPSVRGHPAFPTGHTLRGETSTGDVVYISGYGGIYTAHGVTRHQRVGALESDTAQVHSIVGPIYYGDSGGPIVHASGKALGIVSRGIPPAYETGPTIEGVLDDSADNGFTVTLRSVA